MLAITPRPVTISTMMALKLARSKPTLTMFSTAIRWISGAGPSLQGPEGTRSSPGLKRPYRCASGHSSWTRGTVEVCGESRDGRTEADLTLRMPPTKLSAPIRPMAATRAGRTDDERARLRVAVQGQGTSSGRRRGKDGCQDDGKRPG